MLTSAAHLASRLLGTAGSSDRDDALAAERFRSLQRQIPLLYATLLVNLVGLNMSLSASANSVFNLGNVLAVLIVLRLAYWLTIRGRELDSDRIRSELLKMFILVGGFCTAYCWWTLALYSQGNGDDRVHVVLFSSLAAVSCSFALSAFLPAARLPLLLLAFPLALQMIADDDAAHFSMGLSMILLILLLFRLTAVQSDSFVKLVYSRWDVELERKRAATAEQVAENEKLRVRHIADTDFLTGIANRRSFLASMDVLATVDTRNVAIALVDLDGFKPINDTFGHETGDQMLVAVSRRLKQAIGSQGTVARLGGDEFALLFSCDAASSALAACEDAIRSLSEPFELEHRMLAISACVGVSFHGHTESDLRQALRQADIALYSAKRDGKGKVALFTGEMEAEIQRRTTIEQALREPATRHNFDLAFQPILDLQTMELRSFEALARWRHSELGLVSPAEFIPITERISVIDQITAELLASAARQALRWPESVRLSFNLSAVELCSISTAEHVLETLAAVGLPPSRLQIEITETAFLADFEVGRRNLANLRERGVTILLDDFGAGYASISYLREMPFDKVKLDGSLITTAHSADGRALLTGVLNLCDAVGLPCVAEHLETEQQVQLLRELGCRFGQGFALARPMGADAAAHFANRHPRRGGQMQYPVRLRS